MAINYVTTEPRYAFVLLGSILRQQLTVKL